MPDSPHSHSLIDETDARAMIHLIGQVATIEGGHQEIKRFLMEGICDLVGADSWVWTLACQIMPGEAQTYAGFSHGGLDEARFAALLSAVEHPDMGQAVENFYTAIKSDLKHTTMLLQDVDPTGVALRSDVRFLWEKADIGPVILSGYPLTDQSLSMIGIYRDFGEPLFSPRENQIAHILLNEVPWLHHIGWPEDRGATVPKLHPRQRIVLNLLMEGLQRKAIAAEMEISENTLAAYTRDVFQHFGVHSQVELMRKFLG